MDPREGARHPHAPEPPPFRNMTQESFVFDLAVVLAVAAVTAVVARSSRQPTVLGYLLAGLVVGPYIPIPIFADPHRVEAMAEFGVVLVMFAVGLEFRLAKLRQVLPTSGLTALLQVGFLLWAGVSLGQALGWSTVETVFLGACLCISSTMLVSQVFAERPVAADVRANVLGILVIQDIAAIVLIAAMTAVAAGGGLGPVALSLTLLKLAAVLVGILGVGVFVVPRAVRRVAAMGSAEMLVVVSVALCFALSEVAATLGYSVALGAFVAGILVAESGKAHEVEVLVSPLRDIFAAIFFVSIGMTVDPRLAWQHLPLSLLVFAVVVVGQLASVSVAGVLSGNGLRGSLTAGLALGQIGEFSFILAGVGIAANVVRDSLRPVLVTVAVLTAFSTPLMLRLAPRVVELVDRRLPSRLRRLLLLHEAWVGRLLRQPAAEATEAPLLARAARAFAVDAAVAVAIVAGAARWSPKLGPWLSERLGASASAARWLLLALVGGALLWLLAGAVRNSLVMSRVLVDRVLPVAADEPLGLRVSRRAMRLLITLAATLGVGVPAIAVLRPFTGSAIGGLLLAGLVFALALYLWRSCEALEHEFESGVQKLTGLMARQLHATQLPQLSDPELPPGLDRAAAVALGDGSFASGKTLTEVHLRALTGATVVAIRRAAGPVALPTGREQLQAGDVLAVVGIEGAIDRARVLLESGPQVLAERESGLAAAAAP